MEKTDQQVTVYSRNNCKFCDAVKEYFKAENITYVERNIEVDAAARDHIIELGAMGVPVVEFDNKIVVGFDKPRIKELVGIS